MKKYVQATSSGKGFITHDDAEKSGLVFEGLASSVWIVTGEENAISTWAKRVNGIEITEAQMHELCDAEMLKSAEERKLRLTDRMTAIDTRMQVLEKA